MYCDKSIKLLDGRTVWVDKAIGSGQGNYYQFDTGGYTGEWGSDGRIAMLHQKELVLNADDTQNLLNAVGFNATSGAVEYGTPTEVQTSGTTAPTYSLFASGQSFEVTPTNGGTYAIYDNSGNDAADEAALLNRYMMIIPGNPGNAATVNVTYEIEGGSETTVSLPLKDQNGNIIEFAAGKAYEFVFTVSNVAVGFNVDVDPWDTDLDGDNQADDDIHNNVN